jgi:hypothetical protein
MAQNESPDAKTTLALDYPPTAIFTHAADLKYGDDTAFAKNADRYIAQYAERFKSYLECNKDELLIGIVYVYVDEGIRRATRIQGNAFVLRSKDLEIDTQLKGVLSKAEEKARDDLKLPESAPPKFCFVGLAELLGVLNNLMDVNPDLVAFLRSDKGNFTYDAPKYVEAVIRLARGDIPHLAHNPIIRVDDDVRVNPEAIRLLINAFVDIRARKPFFFFSGKYGREDHIYDPVNDYAVRTDWFFPVGTQPGDERFSSADPVFKKGVELAEKFLADLTVLGATQPPRATGQYSEALKRLINAGDITIPEARPAPQIISGAGLIMARRSVALLPPFMDFDTSIIWIDDYLKRRLHEMLGDIASGDLESVGNEERVATFEQKRHKPYITQGYIDSINKAKWYFPRLMAGCMLLAMIIDETGTKDDPSYSKLIRDIVWFKKNRNEIGKNVRRKMKARLRKIGIKRYEDVLGCWSSEEFAGYASYEWAKERSEELEWGRSKSPKFIPELCEKVVNDAIRYIDLLLEWHIFTRAVERMMLFIGNLWLFEPIEKPIVQ